MKKALLLPILGCLGLASFGQFSSTTVEIFNVHDGVEFPELAGYTTYRVWVNTVNENDFLSIVYGYNNSQAGTANPFTFNLTSGQIFQSEYGSHTAPNCNVLSSIPVLAYDSYFTIGAACMGTQGENVMVAPSIPVNFYDTFEQGVSVSAQEAGVFTVQDYVNGWSGEAKKVLVAQFTTNGPWEFCFALQGQISGIPGEENTFSADEICANSAQGVAVEESAPVSSVAVFPNPTRGIFSTTVTEPTNVTVYDLMGNQVEFRVLQAGVHEFDLSKQADGVYVVVLRSESNTVTKRMVKH